jgi:hypothetical protein
MRRTIIAAVALLGCRFSRKCRRPPALQGKKGGGEAEYTTALKMNQSSKAFNEALKRVS